jgi:hypothetical protein
MKKLQVKKLSITKSTLQNLQPNACAHIVGGAATGEDCFSRLSMCCIPTIITRTLQAL